MIDSHTESEEDGADTGPAGSGAKEGKLSVVTSLLDGWSLVLVGIWNRAIFSDSWVGQHVFESEEVQVEFPLGNPTSAPRLISPRGVRLFVASDRLVLSPDRETESALFEIESCARRVLTLLPHTPLAALGINFQFEQKNASDALFGLFEVSELRQLGELGYHPSSHIIHRKLKSQKNAGCIINVSLREHSEDVVADVNFHYDPADSELMVKVLNGRSFLEHRDMATCLLAEAYHFNFEAF